MGPITELGLKNWLTKEIQKRSIITEENWKN